jgi:hypothetical protein
MMFDRLRGTTKILYTNSGDDERTSSDAFQSFDSDGFTVKYGNSGDYYINRSGQAYVAWCWKANGSGVSNTVGSTSSTVSANTDAGISIVTYTGKTAYPQTIGHGLGAVPEMIIVKNRSRGSDWAIYHKGIGNTKALAFNTSGTITDVGFWGNTTPTSTVFTTHNGYAYRTNGTTDNYVAYCFAPVDGFSKFGSYVGNGQTGDNATNVYTGFRPGFLLLKGTNGNSSWLAIDSERHPYNRGTYGDITFLAWNSNGAEQSSGVSALDFTSTGFKLRQTGDSLNTNGTTYIYFAFAENPFKYATAY